MNKMRARFGHNKQVLPALGMHHKAIPDLEPTLPKACLKPDPTQGANTSLVSFVRAVLLGIVMLGLSRCMSLR